MNELDSLAEAIAARVLSRLEETLKLIERESYRRGYLAGYSAGRRGRPAQPGPARTGRPRKQPTFLLAPPPARQPWDAA